MKIEVQHDVPIPEDRINRESKYPFADMKVGSSFFYPGKTSDQLSNAASHWRKKFGWSFLCMNITEGGVAGARIWRKT